MFERVPIKNRHSTATHPLVQIQIRPLSRNEEPFRTKTLFKEGGGA